ncbi:BTAD domain-containing putative transcriptional regulator [Actinoplanes sp. HUAS TT8]|uniref:AfsR/SARP family transcriptional regulator n=1 Tax=Actinoplanes sp. HUAS TT8 TaxID=3447453 RepID=UPI003F52757E
MRWRLLGPVCLVGDDGREIDIGTGKQRCLLAALLMTPGRVVPADTLIDRVWGDTPPRSATPLAPYATRLRRILDPLAGPDTLRWTDGGYVLDIPPDRVDLYHARLLIHDARTAAADGDHQRAGDLLNAALADWQDVTLAGVPGAWAERVRAGLDRERLDAIAQLGRAGLRLGRAAEVAERLIPFAAEEPTAEGLVEVLMRALAEAGRPTQALEEYARAQAAIADQLGTTPGPGLTELHTRILRATHETPVPAQLPPAPPGFTGRTPETALLDTIRDAGPAAGTSRLAVITGPPGIGKSALATHWGHHAAPDFPDGQLYLDLRGFDGDSDRSGTAMTTAEAARNLIVALDPGRPIPDGPDARTGMLRSLLTGRRMLLVLDNARDAAHVRPLLPGTPGVAVVVTSRDRLDGLVASHGAIPVVLDPLTHRYARQLLAGRLGNRLAAEPDAASALVDAAAGLPLALVAIAARAALRPGRPLTGLAAELAASRLDGMRSPDAATDPRTVFSRSYRALSPAAARLFRLLGTHPAPDVTTAEAAALSETPPLDPPRPEASQPEAPALAELAAAGLLTERPTGRWAVPDLLRIFAAGLPD